MYTCDMRTYFEYINYRLLELLELIKNFFLQESSSAEFSA